MEGVKADGSPQADVAGRDAADLSGKGSPNVPAPIGKRLKRAYVPASVRMQSSVTPIRCTADATLESESTDEKHARFYGFGVAPGTLELVTLQRPELVNKQSLPLSTAASGCCAILQEYSRPWRALRLSAELEPKESDGLPQEQCLLGNYEPQFLAGSPTFPSAVEIPAYLKPRVAVDEAFAFVVIPHIRFGLGTVEPLFCNVVVYDTSLCCRVTEEHHFTLAGPSLSDMASNSSRTTHIREGLRAALLYILPNHQPQQLYLVLKVAKILSGDGDSATAPYWSSEKLAAPGEQQKLIDRAVDCAQRLGRYRQPLAWGAISLMEGMNRPMTLYRQRATMSDELRIPMIADAVRGTLKEKIIPATCEFDLKRVDHDYLLKCKFQPRIQENLRSKSLGTPDSDTPAAFSIVDPFTAASTDCAPSRSPSETPNDPNVIFCREVQPFCHPSMVSMLGLTGSGPVATSFINALYIYPARLERFQHRNVAVQVQLLEKEIDAIESVSETELQKEVLPALYYSNDNGIEATRSAYTLVSYHQKNPQFENEFKICLPEQLSPTHHVLFTFYHVHCKKLQADQQQQELIGYAVLPLLDKDGTILDDVSYQMPVFPAPNPGRQAKATQRMILPENYVKTARETSSDATSKATSYTCRTRLLSSIYSQDKPISDLLEPFHNATLPSPICRTAATTSDTTVAALLELRQADAVHLRYFLLSVTRIVLEYLRTGPSVVRWAAFRALLAIFEKVSGPARRSLKPPLQEANQILHHLVQLIFDEETVVVKRKGMDEGSRQEPLYRAIMKEWLHVLQDNSPGEENIETKRVSITFSHVLLQLVLKSIAMSQLSTKRSSLYVATAITATRSLPQRLVREDDLLIERLASELILCAGNTSLGLLLQKEANQSIAWFCRGLFLVVLNSVPARIVCRYVESMDRSSGDPNTLVHLLLPFLHVLIDFEYFATVNGATTQQSQARSTNSEDASSVSGEWMFKRAWLAHKIFHILLRVVDEQKELKIACGAARLIRHLFVVHVQNPRLKRREDQETIALAYAPFVRVLAEFTAEGKLFAGGGPADGEENRTDNAPSSHFQLKKELLICVAHLLSVVSSANLPKLYHDEPEVVGDNATDGWTLSEWRHASALSPTSALMYYRKVVNERKESSRSRARLSLLPLITEADVNAPFAGVQGRKVASSNDQSKSPPFDEVRVHACFALIRHVIDVFLVDASTSQPDSSSPFSWKRFLSPTLSASEALTSLQELEYQVKHRGSYHRMSVPSLDEAAATGRRVNTPSSSSSQTIVSPARLTHSGSVSTISAASPTPRTPMQRSMPRPWVKTHAIAQQKRGPFDNPSLDAKTPSSFTLVMRSGSESTRNLALSPLEDHEEELCVTNLRRIIAESVLRALQTAVNQFEPIIRLIETPLDHHRRRVTPRRESSASIDQAYTLLGSLTELLFFLLSRASKIACLNEHCDDNMDRSDDDGPERLEQPSVVIELLSYLMSTLERFQISLFACRVPGLPLIHDELRVRQLMTIACIAQTRPVRRHAAMLLSALIATCYDQTGSFQLIKGPILKVLTSVFYPDEHQEYITEQLPSVLLTESLRELIEEMRQCFASSERESRGFLIQVMDLLNGFTTQIKVYEVWRGAVSDTTATHDFEEIEDGIFHVFLSLSSLWLVDQKQQWLRALLRLHLRRENFAEAVVCKLLSIQVARDAAATGESGSGWNEEWILRELMAAREIAERASWPHKEIEICEELLVLFKKRRRYTDYQWTLRHLDGVIAKVATTTSSIACLDAESDHDTSDMTSGLAFYRVKFAGDSVSSHIARNEYIYKRSTFTSLGDFIGEIKTMLRAKYPMCERVDVIPESKPIPSCDDQPNVIFVRVSSVEQARHAPLLGFLDAPGAVFKLATPFTLSESKTYGKTSEQLKRVTYMAVAHAFPCALSRQVVQRRAEAVRCPIETAMDDIRRRCALLRAEISKEMQTATDLKTLTLVLKGSVDTHVHGGIPEVIESFLAASMANCGSNSGATDNERGSDGDTSAVFPTLLTATGTPMGVEESRRQRHELANLLVEFAVLCCCCLLISREAFHRCSTLMTSTVAASGSSTAAPFASSLLPVVSSSVTTTVPASPLSILASEAKTAELLSSLASPTTPSSAPRLLTGAHVPHEAKSPDELLAVFLPDTAPGSSSGTPDGASDSPLQQELERSFAALVALMHAQIQFPFAASAVLSALLQRLERLRMKEPDAAKET